MLPGTNGEFRLLATAIARAVAVLAIAAIACSGQEVPSAGKVPSSKPRPAEASTEVSGNRKADIQRAIADLASSDFVVRDKASHALWIAGAEAEPALEKAVRDAEDFEVVYRARQILDSFQLGVYPDTPADVVQLIGRFRMGNYFMKQSLAQQMKLTGKTDLLRRLIAKESNPFVRDQLNQFLANTGGVPNRSSVPGSLRGFAVTQPDASQVALAARQRLARRDLDGAERLLREATSDQSVRDYAALLLSRGTLDAAIKQLRANLKPTDGLGQRRLAWMLRANGDLTGALAAARLIKDNALIEDLQAEMADWKELAKVDAKADVDALAAGHGQDDPQKLARIIAFRRLAGDKPACDLAVAAAVKAMKQGQFRGNLPAALVLNDRMSDVIEASKQNRVGAAFGLLVGQGHLKEAFQLVKIDVPVPAKIDWKAWLRDGKGAVTPERRFLAREVVRALHVAGEEEQARKLVDAVLADAKESAAGGEWEALALNLLELQVNAGRPEMSDTLAAILLDLNPKDPGAVIGLLYRDQDTIAVLLWKALRKQLPGEDRPTALKHLRRLLTDKPGEASVAELTRLVPGLDSQIESADSDDSDDSYDEAASNIVARRLLAVATLCHHYGQSKLTTKYLARISPANASAPLLIEQGNLYAEEKLWNEAAKAYEAAWTKDRRSAAALYLLGWAQVKRGDEAEGRKQMELALMVPLADGESRHDLVQTLVKLQQNDEADRQRQWLLRLAPMHDWSIAQTLMETGDAATEKADTEKGDPANLAIVWQRVAVELLLGNRILAETRFYMQPSFAAHSARARELLRAGKTAEAIAEIHQAEAIQPADLQLALDCDADLRKHGAAGEADALYRRLLDQHEAFCRDFPKSSTYHNDLAWLAANLDRDLDKALTHAQRAVDLEPESAGILDTLAEVHFRRGNQAEAVRLAKRCLEMEPKGEHYQKQLARFEAKPGPVPK